MHKVPKIPKLKVEKEMTDVFFYKNKNYNKKINIPYYIKGEDNVDEDNLQIFYNNNNVCEKGSINKNYGLKAFFEKKDENIGLFVIKFKENLPKDLPYVYKKYAKDTTTLGLMVITEDKTKENQLNIELLCTKKNDIFSNIGTVFLDYVYDFALKNQKDVIFLESLPEAKGFYEKLGFKLLKEKDGLYEMEKNVEKKDIYNRIRSSISRISSRISKKTTPQSKQPPLSPVVSESEPESESENTSKIINLSKSLGGNTTRKQKKNKRHKKHTRRHKGL